MVDPKGADYTSYRGADVLKPHRRELALATGMPVADRVRNRRCCAPPDAILRVRPSAGLARSERYNSGRGRRRGPSAAGGSARGVRRLRRWRHGNRRTRRGARRPHEPARCCKRWQMLRQELSSAKFAPRSPIRANSAPRCCGMMKPGQTRFRRSFTRSSGSSTGDIAACGSALPMGASTSCIPATSCCWRGRGRSAIVWLAG